MTRSWKGTLAGFGVVALLAAGVVARPRAVKAPGGAVPAESPSDTCYKYTYPKDKNCGKMSGKTECESEPSIDEDNCKVEKGAECTCKGDDDE